MDHRDNWIDPYLCGYYSKEPVPDIVASIETRSLNLPKKRHQGIYRAEGLHTNEMYVGGMSSSLPEDVQLAMYRTRFRDWNIVKL